ncbi:MAG: peptidylprolyl isomerase [Actinobacteria bacterium]|nr:peptidylprolyl isomerase [Actinomycetota bacterium]
MKFLKYGLAIVLITAVALTVAGCSKEPLAATVNGKKITVAEVNEKLEVQMEQFAGQYGDMFKGPEGQRMKDQLRQAVLDQLINMELVIQEVDRQGIKITDKEVDAKVKEIIKIYNLKDEKDLEQALKQKGTTVAQFKEEVGRAIKIEKLISKGIKVSSKDIEKYFKDNKKDFVAQDQIMAAHILVQKEEDAKNILEQIKGGADFAQLAKQYSTDPGSKDKGGRLDWADKDDFVPEFADACWKLNPNEISDLVKTDYGYHIIKLIDKKPSRQMELAEVRDQVKERLLMKKKQEVYTKLIDRLKKKADIKMYPMESKATSPQGVAPGGAQPGQPPAQTNTETGK